VEIHRAHIMDKLHASGLSDLVRIVLVADSGREQALIGSAKSAAARMG
jgi:hypothetical protein